MINDVFGSKQSALENKSSIATVLNLMNSKESPEDKKIIKGQFDANMANQNYSEFL